MDKDKNWKGKLKFFKTVPGILLSIAVILAILAASLFVSNRISNIKEEKRIAAELEHKGYKDITHKDFRMLYKNAERIDPAGELDKFVESGRVAWMVTQGHEKDAGSVKIVGRYKFDIAGKAQFFKTTPRTVAVSGLENWADRFGAKVNNLPADPEPPSQGIWSHVKSGPGVITLIFFLLLAFLFLWFFLWGPMSGLNRFAKGRELKPEKNDTRFSDVAGIEEKLNEAREAVDILLECKEKTERNKNKARADDKYKKETDAEDQDTDEELIRGILMTGPPGTGKTLISRAIAGEAGVPFYHMNGSDFVEMFVGVGPKRVRALFSAAKKNAPSIVFIDEIDAVAKKRQPDVGFGGDSEYSNTVNALLTEIDGFDKDAPILIIGATNRPEILDDALLRPGRFTRRIHLDPPEKEGRKAILELYAKRLRRIIAEDVSFETLARETPGFAGDHLRNLVNEANILARRRKNKKGGRKVITKADFDEAFDRVIYGPEKTSRVIMTKEKRMFAEHEAGHALVGYELEGETKDTIYKASIIQRDNIGGHVQPLRSESPITKKTQLKARMAVYAAGFVAEEIEYSGDTSTAASSDMEYVTATATNMVREWGMVDLEKLGFRKYKKPTSIGFADSGYSADTEMLIEAEIKKFTLEARTRAREILELEKNRKKFLYLVERLIEKETISGDALREMLKNPVPESWRGKNE